MTEREALAAAQKMAAGEFPEWPWSESNTLSPELQACATLVLANRVHLQQLKGELADLRDALKSNDLI